MVHLVTAVLKPHRLEDVKEALRGLEAPGMGAPAVPRRTNSVVLLISFPLFRL